MIWPDGDSYVGAWENGQIQVQELTFKDIFEIIVQCAAAVYSDFRNTLKGETGYVTYWS